MTERGRIVTIAFLEAALLASCGSVTGGGRRTLSPEAYEVQVVTGNPDQSALQYLGDVQGSAKSGDMAEANRLARIDLRNRAAALGATVVTIDTVNGGNALDSTGRNEVVLSGRAYSPRPATPPTSGGDAAAAPTAPSTTVEDVIDQGLDANRQAILHCTGGQAADVVAAYSADGSIAFALVGSLAGSPAEACIRRTLGAVRLRMHGTTGVVRHTIAAGPTSSPPTPASPGTVSGSAPAPAPAAPGS